MHILLLLTFLILRNASVCSSLFGGYGEEVSCLQSINGFPLGPKIEKIKLAAEGLNFNVLIALSPLNLTNGLSSILLLFKVALKVLFYFQDY